MLDKTMNKKGFTLVELMITVAIVAILVAISIPIFSSATSRAKASADMANIRNAKAVASAKYLQAEANNEITYYYDAESGKVTTDKTAAASFAGYGQSDVQIKGASGLPVKNGKAQIVSVTFAADGTSSAAWGIGNDMDELTAKAMAYDSTGHSGDDLINAMGTLPSVQASDIFGNQGLYGGATTLYWRPKEISINGTKTIYLYANADPNGHANWQGYAIYYNGTIYKSKNRNGYSGLIDRNSVLFSSSDVGNDLAAYILSTGKWEKAKS